MLAEPLPAVRFIQFTRICVIISGVMAAFVLVGWGLGIEFLKSGVPGFVAMNPLTAMLFLLSAVGVGILTASTSPAWKRPVINLIVTTLVVAGLSVLAGYAGIINLGLDQRLFASSLDSNRMAPNTAFFFTVLGLAIYTLDARTPLLRLVSQLLCALVIVGASVSLIGYGYNTSKLYGIGSYIPMALNTALVFEILALGLMAARPETGIIALLNSPHAGGSVARKLIPAAVVIPIVLGFMRIVGQRGGLYDMEFGAAMMVIVTVVLLCAAIMIIATELNQSDVERKVALEGLRKSTADLQILNDKLELRVLERTGQLQTVNRDLSHKNQENELFVYSVSHDLRSPLVSLQGFSKELAFSCNELRTIFDDSSMPEELRQKGLSVVDGDMQQSVKFIQSAALRLGNIIDALLRLSRAGRVEYANRTLNLNQLLARLVDSVAGELHERGVTIEVNSLPNCQGDPAAIEQLFANLIGNALKYSSPERAGEIEIGAVPASVRSEHTQPGMQTYFVKDNGLGISHAYHEKIFQAFKRFHLQAATGEGMGLAIVKRIVERHGGQIWVESSEGQGSTFFVNLPAHQSGAVETAPRELQAGGCR